MQPEIEEAYAYLVTSDGRILLNEVSEEDFQKLKIYHHPLW